MPMPPYPINCYTVNCNALAQFKVAARWSDGITHELKTYALCCQKCLAAHYRAALAKRERCRLAAGETLEKPAIFEMTAGKLQQRTDLEQDAD